MMSMNLDNLSEPSSMSVLEIVKKDLKFSPPLKVPSMVVFPSLILKNYSQVMMLLMKTQFMTQKLTEREFTELMLINTWLLSNLMLKLTKNNSDNGLNV